jgi:CRP-like cAMP-binding protein/di/tricarboxylate transporter
MAVTDALVESVETAAPIESEAGAFRECLPCGADSDVTPLAAAEALAGTPFFAGLSSLELARLVPELEERCYSAGAVVFSQGDSPDGLYVIRRGEARVLVREANGTETLLATLGPPEYFGEMALVSSDARSATVKATGALEVWRLSTERFGELVARHTDLPLEIASALSRRLATADRKLSHTRGSSASVGHESLPTEDREWFAKVPDVGRDRPAALEPSATAANGAGLKAPGELRQSLPPAPAVGAGLPREGQVLASDRSVSRTSARWHRLRQLLWSRGLAATAAALLVGAWFVSPPPDMSPAAFRTMLLLAAALTVNALRLLPDFLTFLLMLALWVVSGIVPARVAASGFASPTWFLILATMVLGAGLARSGLPYRAALWMLQQLPPRYPLLASCLAGLGVLVSPGIPYVTGRVVLAGPVAQDIADSLRYPSRSSGSAGLALATLLGFGMMGSLFLTGNPMALVVYGLLPPASRAEMTFLNWFVAALPLHLVLFVGMLAFIFRWYRPGEEKVSERTLQVQSAVLGRVRGGEWLALTVLLLLLVGFSTQPIHGIEPAWLGLFGVAAMIARGLANADILRREVNWPLLLYFGVVLSLGEVFRAVGLDTWLAGVLVPLLGMAGTQSGLLILGITLLAMLTSLLLGMLPAILLLVLALPPISAQVGISPWIVGLTVIVAANQWLYPQQNIIYLSLYHASGERAFSHAQARPAAVAFAALTFAGLVVSIPYWQGLGLLR